jgi:flagellar basal body P-ring formation protein FlgA
MTNTTHQVTKMIKTSISFLVISLALTTTSPSFAAQKLRPGASLLPAAALSASPAPAAKYSSLMLKSEAIINDDIVRLSDLIDGLDPRSDIAMFRAPDLGQIGTIQTSRVLAAATENRITGIDTRDLSAVIVRRSGHIVPQDQMLELVSDALRNRYNLPIDTDLVIDKTIKPLIVEADARRTPQLASFYYDSRTSRFDASITIPGSEITNKTTYKITGTLGEFVRVPVVIRELAKGGIIGENDIVIEKRKRVEIFGDAPIDLNKVKGQIAKRGLRAGDIIGAGDITKAEWVERGSNVTIVFETAGLSLSTKGKAITGGGQGDTVSILNLQSKRQIEGVIIAPGKVSVQPQNVVKTLKDASAQNTSAISGLTPTRTASTNNLGR